VHQVPQVSKFQVEIIQQIRFYWLLRQESQDWVWRPIQISQHQFGVNYTAQLPLHRVQEQQYHLFGVSQQLQDSLGFELRVLTAAHRLLVE
jgi:hypothetical protein